ncbi:unnamed protein product [Adineta steineri]|uniref:Peptidase S8/S53 domain-containing protein n=3 Tax=Adineta steineri TaxID=433720 RepID=A0A814YJ09_9BILA|nr:unnamed protein product [Adineta steineri]
MQTTLICFVLFVLAFNIYAQFSPDNGQILVNNQGSSQHLVSSDGGIAATNGQIMMKHTGEVIYKGPAPRPINQKGSRRRKRQQPVFVHQPQIHSTIQDLLDKSNNDNTHTKMHILFREYEPFNNHYSTFDNFSNYISALNTHREPMNAERRQTLIVDYGAEILGEFWLTNSMYVKMPVEDVKRYAQEQQHHYILLHPGYEEGGVWGLQDPSVARQAIGSDWLYNAQSSLNNTHECIAVIDSGVRKTHTLFNSPNRINRTVDCIYGGPSCTDTTVNPTLYDSDDDCLSHGTAVASVISANSNDGDSLHGISTACINSYKVFQTIHSSETTKIVYDEHFQPKNRTTSFLDGVAPTLVKLALANSTNLVEINWIVFTKLEKLSSLDLSRIIKTDRFWLFESRDDTPIQSNHYSYNIDIILNHIQFKDDDYCLSKPIFQIFNQTTLFLDQNHPCNCFIFMLKNIISTQQHLICLTNDSFTVDLAQQCMNIDSHCLSVGNRTTIPPTQSTSLSSTSSTTTELSSSSSTTSSPTTESSSLSSSSLSTSSPTTTSTISISTISITMKTEQSSTSTLTTLITTTKILTTLGAANDNGKWKTTLAIMIPLTVIIIVLSLVGVYIVKRQKKNKLKESIEMDGAFVNPFAKK